MGATGVLNKAFGRATSIPRKLKIIPKNADTPQGALDILRGKSAPQGSSFFGRPLGAIGRQNRTILGTTKKKGSRGESLT